MKKAIDAIQKLPDEEQDSLATWILAELESDQRWADLFAQSEDILAELADEALAEHRAGKTLPFDSLDDQ